MAQITLDKPVTKEVVKKPFALAMPASRFSLPLILLLQAGVSFAVLHNTAFQDEALYMLAGRQIIEGWLGTNHFAVPWAYFLSGYAYFYPIISGALDMIGGVELARTFSLLCTVTATVCVYYIAKHFFDRNTALLGAALFAFQAPVLFLGLLATYDALCLVLITLSVSLALHASITRKPWSILGLGPLLILAVLAKFAGLLFIPIPFAILIWYTIEKQGWRKMFVRLTLAICSLVISSIITYLTIDKDVLHAITASTTNRDVIVRTAALFLVQFIFSLSGMAFALGLLGLLLLVRRGRLQLFAGLLLFGAALLAPAYHIYKGELISLHKHLAFSMFFIAPLAGYAITRIAGYRPNLSIGRNWLAGLAICLVTFSTGLEQAQNLYNQWAPSNSLVQAMRTQVRLNSGHYLAEDFDVCRFYLEDITAVWQWSSLDFFDYTNKTKQYLVGRDAYHAAIQEGYFDIVELSYGYDAPLAVFLDQELKASKNYQLIAKIPNSNSYGTGYFWVWRKL